MADPAGADLATLAARFSAALQAQGVPVDPQRAQRFAAAVQLVGPGTQRALYCCAAATLVSDPAQLPVLARVFALVFGGLADPASERGQPSARSESPSERADREPRNMVGAPPRAGGHDQRGGQPDAAPGTAPEGSETREQYPTRAAAAERLAHRDFAGLSDAELAELSTAMRRLRLAPPPRRCRRARPARDGRVDLRATLRRASHTAGQPIRLRRRAPRWRARRLVVLVDISGSMAPYARAVLQLLYCAAGGVGAPRSEVFSFATRLTRLTRVMRHVPPSVALARAGATAPDWAGGTRIGAALREFTDRYGARGMARGAVVLIVSDGWDTGEPAQLSAAMARLARLAYRIVWVNPRSAGAGYQPLVRGMAAAWPYCDAVVSGHRWSALDELLTAISTPRRGGRGSPKSAAARPGPGDTGSSRPGEVGTGA